MLNTIEVMNDMTIWERHPVGFFPNEDMFPHPTLLPFHICSRVLRTAYLNIPTIPLTSIRWVPIRILLLKPVMSQMRDDMFVIAGSASGAIFKNGCSTINTGASKASFVLLISFLCLQQLCFSISKIPFFPRRLIIFFSTLRTEFRTKVNVFILSAVLKRNSTLSALIFIHHQLILQYLRKYVK